jgi:SAM-dependent methyltransferase
MTEEYNTRLSEQKQQYKSGEDIHDLPNIFHYWSNKYLKPKVESVFGVSAVSDFYARPFCELFSINQNELKFVSVGSGDCGQEIGICQYMLNRGFKNFCFLCLEVNEHLISQAREKIKDASIERWVQVRYFDVNRDRFDFPVDGFMAHHSLHHILELERLFGMMDDCLQPHGKFVTQDMIGRNGHMRWPETLNFVNAFWAVTDPSKKINHQLKVTHEGFVNFDCSKEGFEGVRSQDVLPLLISHFSFSAFMATGGLIEIFVDRGYGPNYSSDNLQDTEFIDSVADLNDRLIALGLIKPTMLFAEMGKKGVSKSAKLYKGLRPEFCVREA